MSMRFLLDGEDFRIRFQYTAEQLVGVNAFTGESIVVQQPAGRGSHRAPTMVTCYIERWDEPSRTWVIEEEGTAWCSHQDQFVKETGRKIALLRATEGDHALRTRACQTYFTRKNPPKPGECGSGSCNCLA